MKKALFLLLVLAFVGVFAFADDLKPALSVSEFTGAASVTLGVDLDQMSIAFSNSATADIHLDIMAGGSKSTTGSGIWGELKLVTDGDPWRLVNSESAGESLNGGFHINIDTAKIHFGDNVYLGIKADGTSIDYVQLPDTGAAVYIVDPTLYYGQLTANTIAAGDNPAGTGPNAAPGVVLGISLPSVVDVTVDFRSLNTLVTGGAGFVLADPDLMNRFALRAKLSVTAISGLTLQAGGSMGLGGVNQDYDIGFGGKVAYKVAISDTMSVTPTVAANAVMNPTGDLGYKAQAGALFAWGGKSKLNLLFSPDSDTDWGYYPGISAGVIVKSPDVVLADATTYGSGTADMAVGLNVSAFAGSIVPNLSANAALEIADLLVADMDMGVSVNMAYAIAMDPMTITPKVGVYYRNNAAAVGAEAQTDIYVKAGLDIANIFPNTKLAFAYNSNDFSGGVGNVVNGDTLGMFTMTLSLGF